jgi:hypothetical protein
VLSGRGLCDGLITRPEESYRLWCVVCGLKQTSWMRRPRPIKGLSRQEIKKRCNIWYEEIGDDDLGIGNLRMSVNCVDDV